MPPALAERRLVLEPTPVAPGLARRFVAEVLRSAGREGWVDAAQLAVSEIVTNAVLHAHTQIDVVARVEDDHLRVEVVDRNPALPAQRSYDEHATTGRGMDVVASVAGAHGVESLGGEGKAVWFCIDDSSAADDPLLDDGGWDLEGLLEDLAPDLGDRAVPARLRRLPVTLWLAAQQHHDAVLREYALHRVEHPQRSGEGADVVAADRARAVLARAVERALERQPEALAGSADAPSPTLELELRVEPDDGAAFAALQDLLDEAERLAVGDLLLARPALPEVVALRDWACEQVVAQLAGVEPAPWEATDARLADAERFVEAPVGWDDGVVQSATRAVVAADDYNRIVAVNEAAALLLGWPAAELLGRRVVAVIPPRYREAHVAGFSRHLTTGGSALIGHSVELPVLRRDGSERACRFRLEQVRTGGSRSVYLAWLDPLDAALPAGG